MTETNSTKSSARPTKVADRIEAMLRSHGLVAMADAMEADLYGEGCDADRDYGR